MILLFVRILKRNAFNVESQWVINTAWFDIEEENMIAN